MSTLTIYGHSNSYVRKQYEYRTNKAYVGTAPTRITKQQRKVLDHLLWHTRISKAEAVAMGIGNLAEVIRQLRLRGVPISTIVGQNIITSYSL